MMDAINKDPGVPQADGRRRLRGRSTSAYDQMPAFMKERKKDYMSAAKLMGLVK